MRVSCAHKLKYCYLLQSKCFFLCLQLDDTSSFLQLRELSSGWRIITNFSYKQRLDRFVAIEYGLHFFKIFHLLVSSIFYLFIDFFLFGERLAVTKLSVSSFMTRGKFEKNMLISFSVFYMAHSVD